jgi:D-serine deaminase-like pyridoxal phosphate-dependent protein
MLGPNIHRLIDMIQRYPETSFKPMVDHADSVRALSEAAAQAGATVEALIDLDVGQHRTGIAPGPEAVAVYDSLARLPGLRPGGIHAYDGHNNQIDVEERKQATGACLRQVRDFQQQVEARGVPVPRRVMGGSVSFPCYAAAGDVETSPGTAVFWDWGYDRRYKDLPFEPTALLLSRIISIPTATRITLDLGTKSIASDPTDERGTVWNIEGAKPGLHNEEHWVMELPDTSGFNIGQPAYVFPTHICPCTALHRYVYVIDGDGRCVDRWEVTARDRE